MNIKYVRICVLKCEQSYEWARKVLSRYNLFSLQNPLFYALFSTIERTKNGAPIVTYLDNIYFDRGRGYLKMHRWSVQNGIGPNLRRNIESIALRDDDNISIMNTYIKHEH